MDDDALAQFINNLRERSLTLSTVESFTGGLCAATITRIPGASTVFRGGLVTYSAETKIALAGVQPEIIAEYGVYSAPCAEAMARGGASAVQTDISLSFTGVAGPDAAQVPVGTCFLGCYNQGEIIVWEQVFTGCRQEIQQAAVQYTLEKVSSLLIARKH